MPTVRVVQDERPLLDLNPYTIAGLNPTFSRAGVAYERNEAGVLVQRAAGVLRSDHWEMDPVAGVDRRHILLEGQRTNLVSRSGELDQWTHTIGSATANAATAPDGTQSADRLTDGWHVRRITNSSAADRYTIRVWAQGDTSTTCKLGIYNGSGWFNSTGRVLVGPGSVMANGTQGDATKFQGLVPGEWSLLEVSTNGAVSAGMTLDFYIYPTHDGGSGSGYFWGAQAEQAAFGSSYVPTTTAPATRSADTLSVPWPHAPQAMSIYLKRIEGGATGTMLQVGINTGPYLEIFLNSAWWIARFYDGTTNVTATKPTPWSTPARGDLVEMVLSLYSDARFSLTQSINGGPLQAAEGGPLVMPGAWGSQHLRIGNRNGNSDHSFGAWRHILAFRGIKSMDFFRRRAS